MSFIGMLFLKDHYYWKSVPLEGCCKSTVRMNMLELVAC